MLIAEVMNVNFHEIFFFFFVISILNVLPFFGAPVFKIMLSELNQLYVNQIGVSKQASMLHPLTIGKD